MGMKIHNKINIILALLILLALWLGGEYLIGQREFARAVDLPPDAQYAITIKYYEANSVSKEVLDSSDQQALLRTIGSLAYAGRISSEGFFSSDDDVYGIVIYPEQPSKQPVIIYLSSKLASYIQTSQHELKISNPEELYKLTKQIYTKLSE